MKKMNQLLHIVAFFSFVFLSCKSVAQIPKKDNIKLTEKQLVEHKKDYAKKAENIGIAVKPEYFYKNKIDLNKVEAFKSVGLDLIKMGNKVGPTTLELKKRLKHLARPFV